MDWKRIALIIGFIFIVGIIGYLIYLFFFAPPPIPPTPPIPPIVRPGFPDGGRGQPPVIPPEILTEPTKITLPPTEEVVTAPQLPETATEAHGGPVQTTVIQSDRNLDPVLSSDGQNVVSFDMYDGIFYRITPNGKSEKLTDQTFVGAEEVQWSPDASKAVIGFIDESNIIYDFEQKKQFTIPKHWEEFDFSPSGKQIVFKSLGDDVDNRFLAIANDDGSGARAVEAAGRRAGLFEPSWSPSGQIISLFREGIDGNRQRLYFIGKNGENFKSAVVEGRGVETQWTPRGDKLLYSGYSGTSQFKPELWIIDALGDSIGENRRKLEVQTWADKCGFAGDETLYCAVPTTLEKGAGIMRSIGDVGEDHLYRIDLATGSKTKIAEPDGRHTIDKVIVSKDQTTLFFTDKDTGKLFSIKL
ncbi:hypothetical protein HY621_03075 [Candidatus Uhrbacteria bacterium]|nr:hypothetical protein [Candidatus Uhrbacteria bacterium]